MTNPIDYTGRSWVRIRPGTPIKLKLRKSLDDTNRGRFFATMAIAKALRSLGRIVEAEKEAKE